MSQAKVDRYKKEKENRKKLMRKQKMMGIVRKGVVAVIAVALIGWLGYSALRTRSGDQIASQADSHAAKGPRTRSGGSGGGACSTGTVKKAMAYPTVFTGQTADRP